ncbi:MAG: hypothetical protein LC725_12695 [Lentisphaerae bacterium]|nr:hypothetical protein [Lentisphaerota bacterium]
MKRPRIYVDTSVFGGCYDDEFRAVSLQFFDAVKDGDFIVVVSRATLDEINEAPMRVQKVLGNLTINSFELFSGNDSEIERRAKAYMDAGIIGRASTGDAIHILQPRQ